MAPITTVRLPNFSKSKTGTVGVHMTANGLRTVYLTNRDSGILHLSAYRTSVEDHPDDELDQWVHHHRITHCHTNALLPSSDYQLLLVEAPDVPPDELRAAMRWKIRDLLDFHVDDAIIDVFDVPSRNAAGASQMMYVVAARTRSVTRQVNAILDAGLNLKAVDIPELCLRNLAMAGGRDETGAVLVHLEPRQGLIVLTRNGTLFFARRLDGGHANLHRENALSAMSLEIQRSLDYCESHLDVGRPSVLLFSPLPNDMEPLLDAMTGELGLPSHRLTLTEIVSCDHKLDPAVESELTLPLGAALRAEERQL